MPTATRGGAATADGPTLTRSDDDELYPIPSETTFEEEDADYLAAFDLEEIGERLIEECAELRFLKKYAIGYLWKRAGAVKNLKATYGLCGKASPDVRYYAKITFLIKISADHCRDARFTNRQMEALIYHELSHCIETVSKKGDIKPGIVGHDLEMFFSEYRRYGAWHPMLGEAERVFRQEELAFDAAEPAAPDEPASPTARLSKMFGEHGREAASWVGGTQG